MTKLLEENLMRAKGNPDFPYATYHWGEPEYGYFLSKDKYVCFHDMRGDVLHRDHDGYGDLHYTDCSGRNDIVRCLVAVDKKNIYFAAETDEPLTPSTDPNWMLLYIDTDEDGKYDYGIQHSRLVGSKSGKDWEVAVGEKCVEVAIPRKLLGKTGKRFSLSFKWADNPICPGDIISVSSTGDTAPNRRFAYRFVWER